MKAFVPSLAFLSCLVASPGFAEQPSPPPSSYAGQQTRKIKALSDEEVAGYLAGRGMGLARAAELNGYPGPMHVLELAERLKLTAEQRAEAQRLFERMHEESVRLGAELVEKERALDALFAGATATPEAVGDTLSALGTIQAKLRAAHLAAHIGMRQALTAEQVASYAKLRGYGSSRPKH